MIRIHVMIAVCILLFSCGASWAEDSLCQPQKTYVFYGNGMFNAQYESAVSMEQLQIRMNQVGSFSTEELAFELSYNHNEGLYSLFEVYRQRQGEWSTAFWRWLSNVETAPDWFHEAALQLGPFSTGRRRSSMLIWSAMCSVTAVCCWRGIGLSS